MKIKPVSHSYAAQRGRLLQYLKQHSSITTLQARHLLAVMHPAGRVKELRDSGHPILTYWAFDTDSAGVRHRQGLYVLKVGGKND